MLVRLSTLFLGGAAVLLYAGLGWLSHTLVSDLDALDLENRTLTSGSMLYGSLLQYEVASREYALTRETRYLRLQVARQAEVSSHLRSLKMLTQGDEQEEQRVARLEGLLQHRFSRNDPDRIASAATGAPLSGDPSQEQAAQFADEVVNDIKDLHVHAERRQATRVARRQDMLWIFWAVLGACGLALAALISYFWGQTKVLVKIGERSAEETTEAAHHDALTGLPNRRMLDRRVDLALAKNRERCDLALLMLDLDGFKAVNDNLGHLAGDELLKIVAHRLRTTVRTRDLVVRLGGDEFVVFIEGLRDKGEVRDLAHRLLHAIAEPTDIAGNSLQVGVSIGLCLMDESITNLASLLRGADHALYQAKRAGKGTFVEYDSHEDIEEGSP
jgi:diguanylate cyclase (GGDEF)-like protein